jgi:hypothetical protein
MQAWPQARQFEGFSGRSLSPLRFLDPRRRQKTERERAARREARVAGELLAHHVELERIDGKRTLPLRF